MLLNGNMSDASLKGGEASRLARLVDSGLYEEVEEELDQLSELLKTDGWWTAEPAI